MDRLDEYDPATDTWRARAPMPQPLDHLGVAVVNNKLYTFGGFIGAVHQGASDAALEYDPGDRHLAAARADEGAALGGRRGRRSTARFMSSAAACATTICWRRTRSTIPRPANGRRRRRCRSRATISRWSPPAEKSMPSAAGSRRPTSRPRSTTSTIPRPTPGARARRCRRRAAAWRRSSTSGLILVVGGETRKIDLRRERGL